MCRTEGKCDSSRWHPRRRRAAGSQRMGIGLWGSGVEVEVASCGSQPTECGMGKTLWAAGTPGMQQANQCPARNSAAGCAAEQRQQQLAVSKMNCGVCAGVRPPGAEMEGSPTAACAHRGMGLSWKSVAQGEAGGSSGAAKAAAPTCAQCGDHKAAQQQCLQGLHA